MKISKSLIGICIAAICYSCSAPTHIYVPSQPNVPMLKESGEFKASIATKNAAAAYAVSNHFAVAASGQYVYGNNSNYHKDFDDDNFIDYDPYNRGYSIEAGLGYFTTIGVKKLMVFDVYSGFGKGSFKTLDPIFYDHIKDQDYRRDDYKLSANFTRFYVQPTIGLVHRAVEVGFTPKFSIVNFHGLRNGSKALPDPDDQFVFHQISDGTIPFLQPTITVRAGYRYIKFHAQFYQNIVLKGSTLYDPQNNINYYEDYFDYFKSFMADFGVSIDIGNWFK
ncbi:hypothetical protein COR50_01350 [Chitinophaga caeni]|uniref:Outer membrane protein beta-barrel domain-containing protein n=1 Tax=Chitinophaga caeni TaxID=2029983 RepID=A0A291QPS1_9BACT|nr:hypothetical protein [Chitinophaga caeni]ATL45915.1 hypothetical protein COR50_01350 [Chitinophaga caeni]